MGQSRMKYSICQSTLMQSKQQPHQWKINTSSFHFLECSSIPTIEIWEYQSISVHSLRIHVILYGVFTYIYHKHQPNVGKYTIHGSYRIWQKQASIFTHFLFFHYFCALALRGCENTDEVTSVDTMVEVYIYLEPKWPIFWMIWPIKWKVNPPKKRSIGFQVHVSFTHMSNKSPSSCIKINSKVTDNCFSTFTGEQPP